MSVTVKHISHHTLQEHAFELWLSRRLCLFDLCFSRKYLLVKFYCVRFKMKPVAPIKSKYYIEETTTYRYRLEQIILRQ